MTTTRTISPTTARRLAITRQRLAGPLPNADAETMMDVVRDLGCLQLDPISAVARSHTLVLWSRLGGYDPAQFNALMWEDKRLFEYWAHAASIVLTEDYPIHSQMMRRYATGDSGWGVRVRGWVEDNKALEQHILSEIRQNGSMLSRQFEHGAKEDWHSTGWTSGRNVSQMLDYLWTKGLIVVAGRSGGQKLWDLSERWLPEWTPREELPEREVVMRSAQRSLRALGVARDKEIKQHFTRWRYNGLPKALGELEKAGVIERVQIEGEGREWPGSYYVHCEDLQLLDRLDAGEWQPRTVLLSPFDNLICDRARTESLFNFYFRIEIYVPPAKRQYGYYVLSILHGDRLIGRIDPSMDRKNKRLTVNAVHAEPDAPMTGGVGKAVAGAVERLGAFLGAKEVVYGERVPEGWRKWLK